MEQRSARINTSRKEKLTVSHKKRKKRVKLVEQDPEALVVYTGNEVALIMKLYWVYVARCWREGAAMWFLWGADGTAPCRTQPAPTAPPQGMSGPSRQNGGASGKCFSERVKKHAVRQLWERSDKMWRKQPWLGIRGGEEFSFHTTLTCY